MGAATLFASTYDGSDDRNGVAANQRDLEGYQVGARYALSKRTYAYLVSGKNELEGPTAATTFKRNNASLGLVHTF
jgi:predicted porin